MVITATLVTFILPESFSSTARIKIERDQTDITAMADRGGAVGYDPYFIQTEFELIQSEVILGTVIERLDLNKEWGKKYANGDLLKTPETMTLLKGRIDLRPVRNTSLIEIRVYSEKATKPPRSPMPSPKHTRPTGVIRTHAVEQGRNQGAGGALCGAGSKRSRRLRTMWMNSA